ncbi:MAG TPA: hypothetical protein VKG92_09280, partial [Flavobacteriales bacterium]|nr:hypothetical protein [Flavobacteriales bacterium]
TSFIHHCASTGSLIGLACASLAPASGQFTAGNVVVYEVGSAGVYPMNGSAIVLREFTPAGTPATVVNIPTTGASAMVGAASSQGGGMSLTPDGDRLVFPGYVDFSATGVGIATTSGAAIPRAVGTIDAAGNFVRVFTSSTLFDGAAIFAAASDGSNFWGAGQTGGVGYFGPGPQTVVTADGSGATHIAIAGGQLSTRSMNDQGTLPGHGIYDIGTGLPTTGGQPQAELIGVLPATPGFQFNAARDVCYVADLALEKWTLTGGIWSLAYTLPMGTNGSLQQLCVDFSGPQPVIYATTFAPMRLLKWIDTGAPSTAVELASTIAIWQGIALAPGTAISTSVPSSPVATQLRAWPDPVHGEQLFLNKVVDATVLDALGKVVAAVRHTDRIPVDQLLPGIYLVRTAEGGVLRFVRE